MMDIQKEREEFEQAVKESCRLSAESSFELGPTGEYKSDATYFGWFMWLQAKRRIQAVPEGFVLVPLDVAEKIELIIRDVAELPDRTSPEDWPEALIVTSGELEEILTQHLSEKCRNQEQSE